MIIGFLEYSRVVYNSIYKVYAITEIEEEVLYKFYYCGVIINNKNLILP